MFPEDGIKTAAVALREGPMKWERREPSDARARTGRQDSETNEAGLEESFVARINPEAWEVIKEEGGRMLSFKIENDFLGLLWRVVWVRRKLLMEKSREEGREKERRRSDVERSWS